MAGTEGIVENATIDLEIQNLELGLTYKELIDRINSNYAVIDNAIDEAIDSFTIDFGTGTPLMDGAGSTTGAGSVGSANTASRSDHVHPIDTSRLAAKPDGTNNLITTVNGKIVIDTKYLPDSIINSLEYKGTFDASDEKDTTTNLEVGHYYICATAGTHNPDGTGGPSIQGESYYNVGDWAIYNGTSWDRIDNTDKIITVNGRTGAIDTYRGTHDPLNLYAKGDIVSDANGQIYICKSNAPVNEQLSNKTYWLPTGSVMDVRVNGESKLNTTTGIVAINIDDLTSEYTSVTANTTRNINGTTYYGFNVAETDTAFEVYKKLQSTDTDMQQIVTHRVRKTDGNIFVACGTTSGATVYIRKMTGNIVGNKLYHHHILLTNTGDAPTYYIRFDVYSSHPDVMNSVSLLQAYASGLYAVSGVYSSDKTTQKPVSHIKIDAAGVWMYSWSTSYSGVGQTSPTNLGDGFGITDTVTAL